MNATSYPDAVDPDLVGTYPASVFGGGGYVWDDVLEYRVWCHPERGAADLEDGNDYYYPFTTYAEALRFLKVLTVPKPLSRSFDSLNTSRKTIPASIVTLRKKESPNGQ